MGWPRPRSRVQASATSAEMREVRGEGEGRGRVGNNDAVKLPGVDGQRARNIEQQECGDILLGVMQILREEGVIHCYMVIEAL